MTTAGHSPRLAVLGAVAALTFVACGTAPSPHADGRGPLYALVDAAARRLQIADAVAASKWTTGGSIEDPARERQVIDAVTTVARTADVDPAYVERAFRNQIDATVGVEYARFSEWKLDPASAPLTAPDLSASRTTIDTLNQTMVTEMAAQWAVLHSPACASDRDSAETATADEHQLDDLYRSALSFATRSYCP